MKIGNKKWKKKDLIEKITCLKHVKALDGNFEIAKTVTEKTH